MPIRIQLSRAKGWRMPPNTVKVDRSTRYGNPYRVGEPLMIFGGEQVVEVIDAASAEQTVAAFRASANPHRNSLKTLLGGKNLACWCKPGAPCHADVLLELANADTSEAHVEGPGMTTED